MRTFIAIPIPQETGDQVLALQRQLKTIRPDLSWTRPQGFHITLLFLGEQSLGDIKKISSTLDSFRWPEAFTISMDRSGLFGSIQRPKVLWLGVGRGEEKIMSLGAKVRAALGNEEQFNAHLTLARFRGRDARGLEDFLGQFQGIELPVERVVLYESRLGAGPPRYLPLKTWKLEGAER